MPANPLVTNYDPKKVVMIFGGVPLGGYADGTFLEISPNDEEGMKKVVGADGEVARAQSNDNTNQVVFTLMQSSQSNAHLSAVRNADKLTGKAIQPLAITDLNGSTLKYWPQAWIRGDPTEGFGKEVGERQWTLDTGQIAEGAVGGLLP